MKKNQIKIISAYILFVVMATVISIFYIYSDMMMKLLFLPENFQFLILLALPITLAIMIAGFLTLFLYIGVLVNRHKKFMFLSSILPISIVLFSIFSIVIAARNPWIVEYLPFIVTILIILFVEFLQHRGVSEGTIESYGKDTKHKKNNPDYYTRSNIISDVKSGRGMYSGIILLFMLVAIFFLVIYIGNMRLEQYQQNLVFILMCMFVLVTYGIGKVADRMKRAIVVIPSYSVIILALSIFFGWLFYNNVDDRVISESIVEQEVIADTLITTKTGSEWTKSENDTVYYHVVQKGESLEYIFNDIHLSLQKAKEQNFNILKKENGQMEIIPVIKYKDELNNGTYLYSGLNPKDTVYLSKLELKRFKMEKDLN